MKFMLDECMPHGFARRLSERGYPDAIHPIHIGLLGAEDHVLVRRALDQDRIIVTANADDFRFLLVQEPLHSGLLALPNTEREQSWRLIEAALAFLEAHPDPAGWMINRVLEVSLDEGIRAYALPDD